jgi:hypothetical protein
LLLWLILNARVQLLKQHNKLKHKPKGEDTTMARGAKPEVKVELPVRENLEALVGEINEVLNLEPAIKFSKKTTDAELVELIKTEVVGNIYEIDFTADAEDDTIPYFSEESKADFEALGIEIQAGSPPEETPVETPAAKGKGKEKPAAAPAKEKATPAPKAKAAPKAAAEPKYSRKQAFADVILAGETDCEQITKKSSALYEKNGGKSNTTSEGWYVSEYGQLIDCLGLGTYDKKTLVVFGINDQKKGKK